MANKDLNDEFDSFEALNDEFDTLPSADEEFDSMPESKSLLSRAGEGIKNAAVGTGKYVSGLAGQLAEGFTGGYKDELQAELETSVFPYYFGEDDGKQEISGLEAGIARLDQLIGSPLARLSGADPEQVAELYKEGAGPQYRAAKEAYSQEREQFKKEQPRASLVSELTGALLNPVMRAGYGGGAGKAALASGLQSGLYASGKSEADFGTKENLIDTAAGALIGAPLGAGGQILSKVSPVIATGVGIGALGVPLITGDEEHALFGLGAGLAGGAAFRGAPKLGGMLSKIPLVGKGLSDDIYAKASEGVDFVTDEGATSIAKKVYENASEAAGITSGLKEQQNAAAKVISDTFQNTIDDIANKLVKTGDEKEVMTQRLKQQLWKDLETELDKATAAGLKLNPGEMYDKAIQSLRKTVASDPSDVFAARKVMEDLQALSKSKDQEALFRIQETLTPKGVQTTSVAKVEGATADELQVLKNLTPEDLSKAGFKERVDLKESITPESRIRTEGMTEFPEMPGEPTISKTRTLTDQGEILSRKETALGTDKSVNELNQELQATGQGFSGDQPFKSTFVQEKFTPEQQKVIKTRVFEGLFPGKSQIGEVNPSEFNRKIVELNKIIENTKSDAVKKVLYGLKDELVQLEANTLQNTEFSSAPMRRKLYGVIKDFEAVTDVAQEKGDRTPKVFGLVDKMIKAQTEGQDQLFKEAFDNLKLIDEALATKIESELLTYGKDYKTLLARQKANPIEKFEALKEIGKDEGPAALAKRQFEEIETINKSLGTYADDITPEGTYLPSKESFEFATSFGTKGDFLDLQKRQQFENSLNLLERYNPEAAKKIRAKYEQDAQLFEMLSAVRGEENARTFLPGTPQGVALKGIQSTASDRGAALLGKAEYKLKNLKEPVSKIIKDKLLGQNRRTPLPPSVQKFVDPLSKAAGRGEGALEATIYMLSQQYPEFREYLNDLEKEE